MNTTTINITLPKKMKASLDEKVASGLYTSVSELIREAVRNLLAKEEYYAKEFSQQASQEIAATLQEARLHAKSLQQFSDPQSLQKYLDDIDDSKQI